MSKEIRNKWEKELIKKHSLELLYYAGSKGDEVSNLLKDIRQFIEKQKEEIIQEIKQIDTDESFVEEFKEKVLEIIKNL